MILCVLELLDDLFGKDDKFVCVFVMVYYIVL